MLEHSRKKTAQGVFVEFHKKKLHQLQYSLFDLPACKGVIRNRAFSRDTTRVVDGGLSVSILAACLIHLLHFYGLGDEDI